MQRRQYDRRLVDGPVYRSIFEGLRGVNMTGIPGTPGQDYERFQPELMVYHDALHDYSTNEPTMDGTACLTYYLSAMQKEGMKQAGASADKNVYVNGGIVRTDRLKNKSASYSQQPIRLTARMHYQHPEKARYQRKLLLYRRILRALPRNSKTTAR